MITWITLELYDTIFNNKEQFRKFLYSYFDFSGKKLTHWNIKIVSNKSHHMEIVLVGTKGNQKKMMTLTNPALLGSTDQRAMSILYTNRKESKEYFKSLEPIWEEFYGQTQSEGIFLSYMRDRKIGNLI
jgi:hypothetical protein